MLRAVTFTVLTSLLVGSPSWSQPNLLIQVPIRWCAVEGSAAVENPACACEDSSKDVLWRRHERTSEAVFIPECNITFRSAATAQQPRFPEVEDPCNPLIEPGCPGEPGDILVEDDLDELTEAFNACHAAWDREGVGTIGIIGLNVRRLVEGDGTPSKIQGMSYAPDFGDGTAQLERGAFVVVDNDFKLPEDVCDAPTSCEPVQPAAPDRTDNLTGHEAAHTLSLPHLAPPPYTMMIDPKGPDYLTSGGPGMTGLLCPPILPTPTSQCGQLRLQALCFVPGVDPLGPNSLVADLAVGEFGNVDPSADLIEVLLALDRRIPRATFGWKIVRTLPMQSTFARQLEFAVALDVDDDPTTGGNASVAHPGLALEGAEVVAFVDVLAGGPELISESRLWHFTGSGFEEIVGGHTPRAQNTSLLSEDDRPDIPANGVVSLDFDPEFLRGSDRIRFQARVETGGVVDLLEPSHLFLSLPTLPICEVLPSRAKPGELVTVVADDLPPTSQMSVLLGSEVVAIQSTDSVGHIQLDFEVPSSLASGLHLVTLGSTDDNAVTADCAIEILRISDCNQNGIDDADDIANGTSADIDASGRPDECEVFTRSCIFSGTAEGGSVSVTLAGFTETCFLSIPTTAGESALNVAADLTSAINADACMAGQGITASASGSTVRMTGFLLQLIDAVVADPGLEHDFSITEIPSLSAAGLALLAFLLLIAGVLVRAASRNG